MNVSFNLQVLYEPLVNAQPSFHSSGRHASLTFFFLLVTQDQLLFIEPVSPQTCKEHTLCCVVLPWVPMERCIKNPNLSSSSY